MDGEQLRARLATARLEDVPVEAIQRGLRLPLHDYLGLELVSLHPVLLELPLREATRTHGDPLHGGVTATLVDVAGNLAIATSGDVDIVRLGLATSRLEMSYRAQPRGGLVRAEGHVVEVSRRAARSRCTVSDEEGRVVAEGEITSHLVPRRTEPGP